MPIQTVEIDGLSPPDAVMDDVAAVRSSVTANRMRVEAGPDDGWTVNIVGDSSKDDFKDICQLVDDVVSGTDDIREFYEGRGDEWLIQMRY